MQIKLQIIYIRVNLRIIIVVTENKEFTYITYLWKIFHLLNFLKVQPFLCERSCFHDLFLFFLKGALHNFCKKNKNSVTNFDSLKIQYMQTFSYKVIEEKKIKSVKNMKPWPCGRHGGDPWGRWWSTIFHVQSFRDRLTRTPEVGLWCLHPPASYPLHLWLPSTNPSYLSSSLMSLYYWSSSFGPPRLAAASSTSFVPE